MKATSCSIAFHASPFFLPSGAEPHVPQSMHTPDLDPFDWRCFDATQSNPPATGDLLSRAMMPILRGLHLVQLNILAHITVDGYRDTLRIRLDITTRQNQFHLLSMSDVISEALAETEEGSFMDPKFWEAFFYYKLRMKAVEVEEEENKVMWGFKHKRYIFIPAPDVYAKRQPDYVT